MLLAKLAKVTEHEMPFEVQYRDFLPLDPHPEGDVPEHKLIILPPVAKRLNCYNNLRM